MNGVIRSVFSVFLKVIPEIPQHFLQYIGTYYCEGLLGHFTYK